MPEPQRVEHMVAAVTSHGCALLCYAAICAVAGLMAFILIDP